MRGPCRDPRRKQRPHVLPRKYRSLEGREKGESNDSPVVICPEQVAKPTVIAIQDFGFWRRTAAFTRVFLHFLHIGSDHFTYRFSGNPAPSLNGFFDEEDE
jgi:hypothetical protein